MNQENSVRTADGIIIDIKELLWKLLEQWKAIIVFVVIIALLFTGLQYTRHEILGGSSANDVTTPAEKFAALDENRQEMIESIFRMDDYIDDLSDYIANSPLMKLNAYQTKSEILTWSLKADEKIPSSLAGEYTGDVAYTALSDALAEAIPGDYSRENMRELVSLRKSSDADGTAIVSTVLLPEDFDEDQVADVVSKVLADITDRLNAEGGSYSLELVSKNVLSAYNSSVVTRQANAYSRLNTVASQRKNAYDKLSNPEKDIYTKLAEGKGDEQTSTERAGIKSYLKSSFPFGVLLGLILYLVIFMLRLVGSGSVQSQWVVNDMFGIRSVGECYPRNEKAGVLDKLLRDYNIVKRRHSGYTDMEKSVNEASETLSVLSDKKDAKKLLFVSHADSGENTAEYIEALKESLEHNGLSVSEASVNVKKGISVGEKTILDNDGVVLILDKGKTSLKDVKDINNKCAYCDIPLMGAAYVE